MLLGKAARSPETGSRCCILIYYNSYSAPVPMKFSRSIEIRHLSEVPVAIFNFKYRSRGKKLTPLRS